MARIRTLKPEFFTDAELCELSPLARLMFAGLWCQADRDGRLEDKPRELKVKCLPYDDCDANALLDDLARPGFIHRYEAQGRRYIAIRHFAEHQRFHKDEKPRGLPPPPPDVSTVPAPLLPPVATVAAPLEHHLGTVPNVLVSDVRMSVSDVRTTDNGAASAAVAPKARAPRPETLQEIWNSIAPPAGLPKWLESSTTRAAAARARLKEHPEPAYWRSVVERLARSQFCRGNNDRGWKAGPDFFLKPGTAGKALEGAYDSSAPPKAGRASEADKDWSGFASLEESHELFEEVAP